MEGFYSVKEVCRLLHVARETIDDIAAWIKKP